MTWAVTRMSDGFYCLETTPDLLTSHAPVLATLHGPDRSVGLVSVNMEYGGDCPISARSLTTTNGAGRLTDHYVMVAVL